MTSIGVQGVVTKDLLMICHANLQQDLNSPANAKVSVTFKMVAPLSVLMDSVCRKLFADSVDIWSTIVSMWQQVLSPDTLECGAPAAKTK